MGSFRVGGGLADSQVTVSTAVALVARGRTLRKSVAVKNASVTGEAFIGGSSVTPSTGTPLPPGASVSFDDYSGPVYGITATGTVDLRVLEVA